MKLSHAARRVGLMILAACGSLDQARDAFCAQRGDVCDASTPLDAGGDGGTDAGAPDAGSPDSGAPDAGSPDSGSADAGLTCPYLTDAGFGTVSGTVTSVHSGSPIDGANVWWGAMSGATCTVGANCVAADSSGNYVLPNVPAGCVIITGKSNGYLLRNYDVAITKGATTPLDIAISTSGILAGTVRWANGSTVSGALIHADGGELYTEVSLSTNSSGQYMSSYIAIGHYSVTATAPDGGLPQTQSVTLTTTGNPALDFVLDGGP